MVLPDGDITKQNFSTTVLTQNGAEVDIEAALNSLGRVDYTLTAVSGSFVLDAAYMEFKALQVSDGGSVLMALGAALTGLAGVRHARNKA